MLPVSCSSNFWKTSQARASSDVNEEEDNWRDDDDDDDDDDLLVLEVAEITAKPLTKGVSIHKHSSRNDSEHRETNGIMIMIKRIEKTEQSVVYTVNRRS